MNLQKTEYFAKLNYPVLFNYFTAPHYVEVEPGGRLV